VNAARRQIGAILLESGRITQDDVERVLEYQRQHGGFLGQALVTLGIVSRDELDWALANQLDVPYIFPNAAAVDPQAAALVSADWALAHHAVPILRTANALTVVSAEPLDDATIEALRASTGLDVELALASAARVRELIHAVYGAPLHSVHASGPVLLPEFIAHALEASADALGISARGNQAIGWYRAGAIRRCRLYEGWTQALEQLIAPPPRDTINADTHGAFDWHATLHAAGGDLPVHVRVLVGGPGTEYLLKPDAAATPRPTARELVMPDNIAAELRILFQAGAARIAVTGPDPVLVRTLVPRLPGMFAGSAVRAIHLADTPPVTVYSMPVDDDAERMAALRDFHFDIVTIDTKQTGAVLDALMNTAPFVFVATADAQRADFAARGFTWILKVSPAPSDTAWELVPVGA